jgi:hypothetical protein
VLLSPPAHERLIEDTWDPDRVRSAVAEIVEDAEGSFEDGWATHPQDSVPYLEGRYEPDFDDVDHERSLWMGETGIRLVLQRLSPSRENADRLAQLIAGNAHDERRELMWGSPGTMLGAAAMYDLTGEARWLELWGESAAWLRDEWDPETGLDAAATGWWTSSSVLRTGSRAASSPCRVMPTTRFMPAAEATVRYAIEEDGLANSPSRASVEGLHGNRDGLIRLLWCHGAPGVVASLAPLAPEDDEHGRLLLAGGELTWRAGPLSKGANLCHGTAGNGYAFLAVFERTHDELWLERARAFAMHSIAQVAHARAEFGRGRHTLWTGDLGTALYLADCLVGGGTVPLP